MKFLIIGGGAGGCGAALELAEAGHTVTLIERRNELLAGSSDDTPCRLGLGFHYIDINTAKKYLRSTISLLKKYPGFILAENKSQSHPYRRWRYFIVKDSQFPREAITKVYEQLKDEYKALVEKDPSNKVLGEVQDFYHEIGFDKYKAHINTDKVELGIETAEQVLNWPAFKKHIIEKVEKHPNITVRKNLQIVDAAHKGEGFAFTAVSCNDSNNNKQPEIIDTDFVINCAWENIEAINHKVGFFMPAHSRTNRLKVIVGIKLPENFEKDGPINSMFFCFGPHCSFTNLGDGTGYISYEPATNLETSTGLSLPETSKRLLYSKVSEAEILEHGKKILEGVVQYIPGLQGAEIIGAKFGIVKTKGSVDIYSANSDFHRRDYSGVEAQQIRWIDNSCMKLLYFLDNGSEVKTLAEQQIKVDKTITNISTKSTKDADVKITHILTKYLQRYLCSEDIKQESEITEKIHATVLAKNKTTEEISSKYRHEL